MNVFHLIENIKNALKLNIHIEHKNIILVQNLTFLTLMAYMQGWRQEGQVVALHPTELL